MSYDTNNIMKDLDVTKPDGATEYGSILDSAMKEIKRIMFYGSSVTAVSSYPYTILITDNTLYCTAAGGTVAAPQLSTISTTGVEKRIVVINDSSAAVIFDAYSTETVDGSITYSIAAGTIAEFLGHGGTDWEVIRGKAITSISDGTNVIKTKIINIGDWNMDTTQTITVAHGLDSSKIRSINVLIRDDTATNVYRISELSIGAAFTSETTATTVKLERVAGQLFDSVDFDSTSYNRGWITIIYVE